MIRRRRALYALELGVVALAFFLAVRFLPRVIRVVVFALDESPYQMTLTPASGRANVSFRQPDRGLVSPIFKTDLKIDAPRTVVLDSRSISVPGCLVEFCDSSPLPGSFRIRMGKTLYDVMEARIEVDGIVYDWQADSRATR